MCDCGDGVVSLAPDGAASEGGCQFVSGADGESALQAVHGVDVLVERRLANTEARGESHEGQL